MVADAPWMKRRARKRLERKRRREVRMIC